MMRQAHRKVRHPGVVIADMVEPSPCPRCGGPRAWMVGGEDPGPTLPVNCGSCGRDAHACPRCGWEWTGLPRSERQARRGACISCQVLELAGERQRARAVPAATAVTAGAPEIADRPPAAFAGTFDATRARSRLLQRLADSGEQAAESRYRCFTRFADVVVEASRRADAVARLEARLRGFQDGPSTLKLAG